jgi:hypothetical protein
MTYILSGLLVVIVAILGWLVLPVIGLIVTIPIQIIISFVNKFLGYMVSRYVTLAFDFAAMIWVISWTGERWGLVTWPAWILAGWCMFTVGNTLILFDIQCYVTDSGAWAPKHIAGDA